MRQAHATHSKASFLPLALVIFQHIVPWCWQNFHDFSQRISKSELSISFRCKNFYYVSDFEFKIYNALDFQLNFFRWVRWLKRVWIQKTHFGFFSSVRTFHFSCFLKKFFVSNGSDSDFEFSRIQRVGFWIKNLTTCQILKWKFFGSSDFEPKNFQLLQCWILI